MEATTRLQEIRARAEAATPGPWEKCSASEGACQCGLIHSIPSDAVVAIVQHKTEDGEWTKEAFQANKDFIAHAREDVEFLLRELEQMRRLAGPVRPMKEVLSDD